MYAIDSLEALRSMPTGSVNLAVTSPPYALDVAYPEGDVRHDAWPDFMRESLAEAFRVAASGGRLCSQRSPSSPWP